MAIEAPVKRFQILFRNEWEPSNTADSTPKIHTGWWNEQSKKHQLTITDPQESEITGSETGYTGIGPNGKLNKFISGIVYANVWATRPQTKELTSISNPKQLTWIMSEEVDRILTKNADNPGGDLDEIGMTDRNRIVESDKDPVVFRYECIIGYTYNK